MSERVKRPRIIVTGAAGLIGRAAAQYLSNDYTVVRLVRRAGEDPQGATVVAELSDLEATVSAVRNASAIVHLAAAARLDADWPSVLNDNIIATRNVLEAARLGNVDRVILASSHHVVGMLEVEGGASIYDPARRDVVPVQSEMRPDSLYGVSKIFGEAIGRLYHDRYGLAVVCLRLGVVRADDDPASPSVAQSAPWLNLTEDERYARTRSVWLSQDDACRLIGSALKAPIRWAVVYGTSDNPRQLWDPMPARTLLDYRPADTPRSRT